MFKRLMNLIRGFFSLFISGLESSNPEALIEAEKENLRTQISRFNENLANHAAFTERLMRQIKTLSAKDRELTFRRGSCSGCSRPSCGHSLNAAPFINERTTLTLLSRPN